MVTEIQQDFICNTGCGIHAQEPATVNEWHKLTLQQLHTHANTMLQIQAQVAQCTLQAITPHAWLLYGFHMAST